MFKFLVKVVVVVLAIQSAMGYLRKEEIISGEIHINYPVLKEKLLKIIPTEKIAEGLQDFVTTKVKESLASKLDEMSRSTSQQINQQSMGFSSPRIIVHVISEGETLSDLSQIYGVPWQVIKKINHIRDERNLEVGQQLRIPFRLKNVT